MVLPQVRKKITDSDIDELAAHIKASSFIQPILLRETDKGLTLIAGHRRLEAAKRLGLETIPATLVEADEQRAFILQMTENLGRKDLSWFEVALGIIERKKRTGEAYRKIGRELGFASEQYANRIASVVSAIDSTVIAYMIQCKRFDLTIDQADSLKGKTPDEQKKEIHRIWGAREQGKKPTSEKPAEPKKPASQSIPLAKVLALITQARELGDMRAETLLMHLMGNGPNPLTRQASKRTAAQSRKPPSKSRK